MLSGTDHDWAQAVKDKEICFVTLDDASDAFLLFRYLGTFNGG
jgi:hypothetical protein